MHRHTQNKNLVIHENINDWNGFSVQSGCGPLVENYLYRIEETMNLALAEYPRICAIRFDLHFPVGYVNQDSAVISRFMEALGARLEAEEQRKERMGTRVYLCRLRYVWVRERNNSDNWHYHICIFLNRDAYFFLGNFRNNNESDVWNTQLSDRDRERRNMATRINGAWASALRMPENEGRGLVHFPQNPVYHVDNNSPEEASQQYADLFHRLSYFSKVDTKHYGDNSNNFGCSRK